MFKGNKKYYYILAAIFIGVIVLQYNMPKPINWTKTYFKKDKIPFGCFVIYNLLEDTYCNKLETNTKTIYDLNNATTSRNNTFIVINDNINITELEYKSLEKFIRKGNIVLLCANNFYGKLEDTLLINTATLYFDTQAKSLDSLVLKPAFEIKYVQEKNNKLKKYSYSIAATESYFWKFDSLNFNVLALNKIKRPVLIQKQIGAGKLILSSTPDAFGNLYIANHPNRYYIYTLLSSIKNNTIIWDEYYKTYKTENKSIFQFIFNNESLHMAYLLLIGGLLFFMAFELKRKQKAIPIIKPLENSTLNFVDVISQVYYNSKNHKYIAEEQIQYFYYEIRKKFGVNTSDFDDTFYQTIHMLSGIELDNIKKLFTYCENLKQAPSLTENDLLELNNRINNFKQKSIR